jgi:hypothetical protein
MPEEQLLLIEAWAGVMPAKIAIDPTTAGTASLANFRTVKLPLRLA